MNPIEQLFYTLRLRQKGKLDEAIAIYRKRLIDNPEDDIIRHHLASTLYFKGEIAAAIAERRHLLGKNANNHFDRWLLVGELLGQGSHVMALAEAQELVRRDPAEKISHTKLGDVYHAMGDIACAIRCYEYAAGLPRPSAFILASLGELYEEANRPQEAAIAFKRALATAPRLLRALLGLGRALAYLGRPAEAREQWKKVIELASPHLATEVPPGKWETMRPGYAGSHLPLARKVELARELLKRYGGE